MSKRRNSNPKPELGALGLLIALVVLGGVGAFLADANGYAYGNLGAMIWIVITAVSFIFGLLYFAQYVLPLPGSEGWTEGLNLLVRYYLAAASRYLDSFTGGAAPQPRQRGPRRKGEQQQGETAVSPQETLPASFKLVGAGLIPGHQVLTLGKGSRYARTDGPGFVMLYRGESVADVIDLRPQKRTLTVQANSRDGIPVETSVTVTFRVRQLPGAFSYDSLIYPYDPDAIFPVSSYTRVDETGRLVPWTEQLTPLAATLLRDELFTYLLDELQQHNTSSVNVKGEIQQRIQRRLLREADDHGIDLLGVGIGAIAVPEPITSQRIKTWQAEWQRKITVRHAAGDAEAVRRIKQARARAQIEIIEKITQSIEAMRRHEQTNLTEIITLRMIEALEEATTNDSVQALIPQHVMASLVMDASNQMQDWISREKDAPE